MNDTVKDHGENRFANGQSSRDLRATLWVQNWRLSSWKRSAMSETSYNPAEVRALSECQSKSRL